MIKYNQYIGEGPLVSEIGVGAWQLGDSSEWKSMTEQEAVTLVRRALDLGVNFFDTAPNYGLGTSEVRLGKALKETGRDKVLINTKCGHAATGEKNYDPGLIRASLEGSLRRLGTEYVDSLIIHNPPFDYLNGNKTDAYEVLEKLVEEGKIRVYGASVDTYEEMKVLLETTGSKVVEAFYNILFQDIARAFDQAMEQGVAVIAKIPLDSGWLSGKYSAETIFDDIRQRWSIEDKKVRADLVARLQKLLPEDVPLPSAAIAFCLAHEVISTVIPGNKNLAQLESNVASAGEELSSDLRQQLRVFYTENVQPLHLPW